MLFFWAEEMQIGLKTGLERIVEVPFFGFDLDFWEVREFRDLVREGGLEPPHLTAPDPKSGVSANFTTLAGMKGKNIAPCLAIVEPFYIGRKIEKQRNSFISFYIHSDFAIERRECRRLIVSLSKATDF